MGEYYCQNLDFHVIMVHEIGLLLVDLEGSTTNYFNHKGLFLCLKLKILGVLIINFN